MALWKVVGGVGKGGIVVREGSDITSQPLDARLETDSIVKQQALRGERLQYQLRHGSGPETGWVSIKLKDKELLVKIEPEATRPLLSALSSSRWLARYRHMPEARVRLVCMFGAGHDATTFANWVDVTSAKHPFIELLLLVLPGRGINRNLPLQSDAKLLARQAADELLRISIDGNLGSFALFGFSVGAALSYALALELSSRGHHPLRMYCAGRAGPSVSFMHPEEQAMMVAPAADFVRWFANTFATEQDVERTEKLIRLSDDDGLLRSIAQTQRSDLALGNSLKSLDPLPKVACHVHVIASRADPIWPAESSSKWGDLCYPGYQDISETWRDCTSAELTSKYFESVPHNELCAEPLLAEVCDDLARLIAAPF